MSMIKKKRFPTDRLKLHQLFEKRKTDLQDLQQEVKELQEAVTEADHCAIHATADAYRVTPELLKAILESVQKGQPLTPELVSQLKAVSVEEKESKEVPSDEQNDEAE